MGILGYLVKPEQKTLDFLYPLPDINPLQYDIRHLLKATQALNDYKPFLGEGILRKILKNTYFEHILVDRPEEKEEHESFFMEQVGKFQDWIKGIKG